METRLYKVTFIINLRETQRDIAAVTTWLKGVITDLGAKVESTEDLGVRDFVRVTHKANPNGHYIGFIFHAKGNFKTLLEQKLKLESEVKRIFIESLGAEGESKLQVETKQSKKSPPKIRRERDPKGKGKGKGKGKK